MQSGQPMQKKKKKKKIWCYEQIDFFFLLWFETGRSPFFLLVLSSITRTQQPAGRFRGKCSDTQRSACSDARTRVYPVVLFFFPRTFCFFFFSWVVLVYKSIGGGTLANKATLCRTQSDFFFSSLVFISAEKAAGRCRGICAREQGTRALLQKAPTTFFSSFFFCCCCCW